MIRRNVSLVKIVLYILSYIVALGYCIPQTPIKCPSLMFGDYCAFKCHCRDDQCKPSGSCRAKYDCAKPYFGYKCQMVDLAPQAKEQNFLNDYNEETCGVRGNKGPITLSFDKPYRFTHAYMRFKMMYRSLSYLKYDIQIKLKTGDFNVDCGPLEVRELSATDAELRCKNTVMDFDMISLEGEGVQVLCSFHISRGRNIIGVANLSKWYKDDGARPEKIRDGDTGLNNCFMACHYDEKIHVKFSWRQEYILHRIVIYNQHAGVPGYLKQFTLSFAYSEEGQTRVELPKQEYKWKDYQSIIDLPMRFEEYIKEVTISHPARIPHFGWSMSICEMEIYGECAGDKQGLLCQEKCLWCPSRKCSSDGKCMLCSSEAQSICRAIQSLENPSTLTSDVAACGQWRADSSTPPLRAPLPKGGDIAGCSGCFGECDSNGVCAQCKDGFKGSKCLETCINCGGSGVCDKNGKCDSCIDGFYGGNCEKSCSNCAGSGGCDTVTGGCSEGCEDGFYSLLCDKRCTNCAKNTCSRQDGNCNHGCVAGFRGNKCDAKCVNCLEDGSCDRNTGKCTHGCKLGFRGAACDSKCTNCEEDGSCGRFTGKCTFGCLPSFRGDACNEACTNCRKDKSCHRYTGACKHGCVVGFFGENCLSKCTNCLIDHSCERETGACIHGCVLGYKGDKCDTKCGNCTGDGSCDRDSGKCNSGCKPGYKGDRCDSTCSKNCGGSGACKPESGWCKDGCKIGFLGPECNQECGHCSGDGSCNRETGRCPKGCKPEFKGDRCNRPISCSPNCKANKCDQSTEKCADGCKPGFYGDYCTDKCGNCAGDGSCDQQNAHCIGGCQKFWKGDLCDSSYTCPPDCGGDGNCKPTTGACTSGCKHGFRGTECNLECPKHCTGTGQCEQMSGKCIGGCAPGFGGNDCLEACNKGCAKDHSCSRQEGTCDYGCNAGFSGPKCDVETTCSKNCGGNRTCDLESGKCSEGCKPGYYGDDCSQSCTKCGGDQSCEQVTGHCKQGCLQGFKGYKCDLITTDCGMCKDSQCNINGSCTLGCMPGLAGDACDLHCYECNGGGCHQRNLTCFNGCKIGFYRHDCNAACGHCDGDESCHITTGVCKFGCKPGFKGSLCTDILDSEANDDWQSYSIIGYIVAGALAGMMVLYFIFCQSPDNKREDDSLELTKDSRDMSSVTSSTESSAHTPLSGTKYDTHQMQTEDFKSDPSSDFTD